jgi:flagellar basal-body rod protein FlgC
MAAQGMRLRHVAENIANVDTPGYQRKVIDFRAVADAESGTELVQPGPVRLDARVPERIFAPDHPLADETGHYDGSNVDLMIEIADAREAQRSYDANLRMFDQARQMAASLLDLLKR